MFKLPRLNLNTEVTWKESVLYVVWKAQDINSLSRYCNTTAILIRLHESINSLPSTVWSRGVTLFPRGRKAEGGFAGLIVLGYRARRGLSWPQKWGCRFLQAGWAALTQGRRCHLWCGLCLTSVFFQGSQQKCIAFSVWLHILWLTCWILNNLSDSSSSLPWRDYLRLDYWSCILKME